jgi:hypothetical protein
MSFAWLRKQLAADRKDPPLPQYYNIEDILVDGLSFGTPTIVEGTLTNARKVELEGLEAWQWLTLEADTHQFVMVLAPADQDEYIIGNPALIVGRSMGLMKNPGQTGEWITLIGARSVHERKEDERGTALSLPGIVPDTPELGKNDEQEQELFAHINDIDPVLELRPYFYLIGKINKIDSYDEHIYDNPKSANKLAGAVHDSPASYRGHVFEVEGRVIDVFKDELVENRRPYDIDNVTRVIVWAVVREPYKVEDLTGKVTESIRPVKHTFELAVVGGVPDLERGQIIRTRGRFLKVHGIPLERNTRRDEVFGQLQSKNFYSKMFVVPSVEIVELEQQPIWVKVAVTVVLSSFFCCVLWLYLKDIRNSEQVRTRPRRSLRLSKSAKAEQASEDPDSEK